MIIEINEDEKLFLLKALWDMNILYNFDSSQEEEKKKFIKLNINLSDKLRGLK